MESAGPEALRSYSVNPFLVRDVLYTVRHTSLRIDATGKGIV